MYHFTEDEQWFNPAMYIAMQWQEEEQMKRGRSELTGGTGDVSPQLLTLAVTQTGANTFTEQQTGLPIPRFAISKGKAMTMELLKVYFDGGQKDNNYAAGGESSSVSAQLSTASFTALNDADPRVIAFYNKEYRGAFTAAGTYSSVITEPFQLDCTDGAGHGILIATDNIFMGINTTNFAGASSVVAKLLYRWKMVTTDEYIGIVQSQQ